MRRLAVVIMVAALAACEPLKSAFSARADVVARVGDETLSVERLATLAGSSKQVPLNPDALKRLSQVWVDYTAFATRMAAGIPLDDSASAMTAMWPGVADLKWQHFHDSLVAKRSNVNDAQLDSAYRVGDVRLFQHILLSTSQNSPPQVFADREREMQGILRQARRPGADFGNLAARYSQDPGSKDSEGLLGVRPRGAFVPTFEDAAWNLAPGAISDVVRSPFGVHIIRRPPLAEVKDMFRRGLEERLAFQFDSLYVDSLSAAVNLKVANSAPALVRQAVQSFETARASNATVASWRGGSFKVKDLVRWVYAMDPGIVAAIPQAPDSQLSQFVKVVSERHLLLEQAERAGVGLSDQDLGYLRAVHDSALRTLMSVLELTPQMIRDSAATDDGRRRFAVAKVNGYLDRVVQGRARFLPIPPFLGEAIREGQEWSVNAAGLRRAQERATEIRALTDSLTGPTSPLQPAPGPAPVPQGDSGS